MSPSCGGSRVDVNDRIYTGGLLYLNIWSVILNGSYCLYCIALKEHDRHRHKLDLGTEELSTDNCNQNSGAQSRW